MYVCYALNFLMGMGIHVRETRYLMLEIIFISLTRRKKSYTYSL